MDLDGVRYLASARGESDWVRNLRVNPTVVAYMFPLVMLVMNVSSVAVLWFGGHRIDSGAMQIGALTAFLTYLMQILMSLAPCVPKGRPPARWTPVRRC